MLQEKYFKKYSAKFNPLEDTAENFAVLSEKKKSSAEALKLNEMIKMIENCDENTTVGLQKNVYHIASHGLAWRNGEAVHSI